MCRWLAYSGGAIPLEELVFKTDHSLIDQSLSARSSTTTTNGDGFGIGWYDECDAPGIYKHTQPAWNDSNLRDVCRHVRSPLFVAHVRAATDTSVQQTNCHPFRHGRWLFVHNGRIREYNRVRRDLALGVSAPLFASILGTTDSEVMFHLALTFGLEEDVRGGVARMAGFIEDTCRRQGIENPLQMTLGIADGKRLYAVRYSSEGPALSLYHSRTMDALREMVAPHLQLRRTPFTEDARAVVSEPLTDLPDLWEEIPESSFMTVESGWVMCEPFVPEPPNLGS